MRKSSLLFVSAFLQFVTIASRGEAAPLDAFPGADSADLTRTLPVEAVMPRLGAGREFMESYSAWIQLEDGSTLLLNLPISNLPEPRQCSVVANYYPNVGQGLLAEAQYSASELRVTSNAINCGPNRLERLKGGRFRFTGRLPVDGSAQELAYDLAFDPLLPAYRRGDGKIHYGTGGKYFEMVLLAPRANVQGTLAIGGQSRAVKGQAYLDYAGQNLWAHEVANFWFCYRFFSPEVFIASTSLTTSQAYGARTVHHVVAQLDPSRALATDSQTITYSMRNTDAESGYDVPGKAVVRFQSEGYRFEIPMALSSHLLARKYILDPLNPVVRAVIRTFIAKPYSFRFRLPTTLQVTSPSGEVKQVSGTAVVEIIFVQEGA